MTADLYAELDDARRAFIAAADRLSNAIARRDARAAAFAETDAITTLTALHDALKSWVWAQRPTEV